MTTSPRSRARARAGAGRARSARPSATTSSPKRSRSGACDVVADLVAARRRRPGPTARRSPARRARPPPRARRRRARASPRARPRAGCRPGATSAAVRQSAPCAISGRPGSRGHERVALGPRGRGVEIRRRRLRRPRPRRAVPLAQADSARGGSAPAAASARRRFSATLAASSAVAKPRLSDAKLPSETPPCRDVNAITAPGSRARAAAARRASSPMPASRRQARSRAWPPTIAEIMRTMLRRRRSEQDARRLARWKKMNSPKTANIPYWSSAVQRS